eukprot:g6476.t1
MTGLGALRFQENGRGTARLAAVVRVLCGAQRGDVRVMNVREPHGAGNGVDMVVAISSAAAEGSEDPHFLNTAMAKLMDPDFASAVAGRLNPLLNQYVKLSAHGVRYCNFTRMCPVDCR